MFHKKLLEVLSSLDPADIKSFRLFLESPYFNNGSNRKVLLDLFDVVMQYGANEEHPELSKERMFKRFYPDRHFVENAKTPLDSIASDLFLMLKKFLHQQDMEKRQIGSAEMLPLLQFYRKNGMDDRFERGLEAARKLNASVQEQGADFYYQCFRLEEEVANFKGMNNPHEGDSNIIEVHQNLDKFYAILKMEYLCAYKEQNLKSADIESIPTVLGDALFEMIAQKSDYISSPAVQIYTVIFQLLGDFKNEELHLQLNELLVRFKKNIPADLYKSMQAYNRLAYTRRIISSNDYNNILNTYHIANQHLIEGYFYIEGKILPTSLRLLVALGTRLKRFDWLKQVLDEHPPERIGGTKYPHEVHKLHYAEYFFEIKEYDAACECLLLKAFENPHLTLLADLLLVKIYYETENPLLEYRIKALDQKVRRTKISAASKSNYYNFLKSLEKLVKYAWSPNHPKMLQLKEEIQGTMGVYSRNWLLEQIEKIGAGEKAKKS